MSICCNVCCICHFAISHIVFCSIVVAICYIVGMHITFAILYVHPLCWCYNVQRSEYICVPIDLLICFLLVSLMVFCWLIYLWDFRAWCCEPLGRCASGRWSVGPLSGKSLKIMFRTGICKKYFVKMEKVEK